VPDALCRQVKALAEQEQLTLDQLVAIALSAQVSAWATKDYLAERGKRGSWDDVLKILAKVPDVEPEEYDKL
jgi:hypothetical protein